MAAIDPRVDVQTVFEDVWDGFAQARRSDHGEADEGETQGERRA